MDALPVYLLETHASRGNNWPQYKTPFSDDTSFHVAIAAQNANMLTSPVALTHKHGSFCQKHCVVISHATSKSIKRRPYRDLKLLQDVSSDG